MLKITIEKTVSVPGRKWQQCRAEATKDATEHCRAGEIYGYVDADEIREEKVFSVISEDGTFSDLVKLISLVAAGGAKVTVTTAQVESK